MPRSIVATARRPGPMIDIENSQSELEGTMRIVGRVIASAFLLTVSACGLSAGEVVVLQGGARIELQKPPVRQGNVVLLTRTDGTLLSVHDADIDWKATAAAWTAAPSFTGEAGTGHARRPGRVQSARQADR